MIVTKHGLNWIWVVGVATSLAILSPANGQEKKDGGAAPAATESKPAATQQPPTGAAATNAEQKPAEAAKPGEPATTMGPRPAIQVKPAAGDSGIKSINLSPNQPGQTIPAPTVQLKPGEKPGVKFDTPAYEFGKIRGGDPIIHDFWFSNTGNGPLEILQVKPSCGCTTAGEHDKIVEPGKSGKIPIRVNTGKMTGPLAKTITVYTNVEGADSTIVLKVQGDVWQTIDIKPNRASFGRLEGTEVKEERVIKIVNNSEEKMALTEIKSDNPNFTADLKVVTENKEYDLTVKTIPPLKEGNNVGRVTMKTGVKDMETLDIPIWANIPPEIEISPTQIRLPSPPLTSTPPKTVRITHNGSKAVQISELKASNEKLKVSMTELRPGNLFQITVNIEDGYEAPPTGDKVTMKTNLEKFPELTIPIYQFSARPTAAVSPVPVTAPGTTVPVTTTARGPGTTAVIPGTTTTMPPGTTTTVPPGTTTTVPPGTTTTNPPAANTGGTTAGTTEAPKTAAQPEEKKPADATKPSNH